MEQSKDDLITLARQHYQTVMNSDPKDIEAYAWAIDQSLKKAGTGYEVLDPTGTEQASVIKDKLTERVRGYQIGLARQHYQAMLKPDPENIEGYAWAIDELLEKAGTGYKALDPTGKHDENLMRAEFNGRLNNGRVALAREHFVTIARRNLTSCDVVSYVYAIDGLLARAGAEYSNLDPSGERTTRSIRQEFQARQMAPRY